MPPDSASGREGASSPLWRGVGASVPESPPAAGPSLFVPPAAAILRVPTPVNTPVPGQVGTGCSAWTYVLKWESPSRLAMLKNALGDSVAINSEYYPPGTTILDNSTTPWTVQRDGLGHVIGGDPGLAGVPQSPAWVGADWGTVDNPAWGGFGAGIPPGGTYNGDGNITYQVGVPGPTTKWHFPGGPPAGGDTFPKEDYLFNAYDPNGNPVTWSWTITWGTYQQGGVSNTIYKDDPGIPFLPPSAGGLNPMYDDTTDPGGRAGANYPPGGVGGSIPGITGRPLGNAAANVRSVPPQDIVGKNKDQVNWGLYTFSDIDFVDADPSQWCAYNPNYVQVKSVDPNDTGDVTVIEGALNLYYYGGLRARGATPTKEALTRAGTNLGQTFQSDPKFQCNRPYGVILCTDGASNTCNPPGNPMDPPGPPPLPTGGPWLSGGEPWISPCKAYWPDPACFDTASPVYGYCCDINSKTNGSGIDCATKAAMAVPDTSYQDFVAGVAESQFLTGYTKSTFTVRPRTFVIGISPNVGKCELNYTAYMGRSDQSAVQNDAGFDTSLDPRLPQASDGPLQGRSPNRYAASIGTGDYAFFASDAASIYDSFLTIINATAAGDYATSAPIAGGLLQQGNITLLASTEFPTWKGKLRAIDILKPAADPSRIRWEAGDVLLTKYAGNGNQDRKIYTWDPVSLALTAVNQGNLVTLAGYAGLPTTTFTPAVVDFIRGNDGTQTNVSRSWTFGASINATPAIIGAPPVFKQGVWPSHAAFEGTYQNRVPLAWVGADDGMLHAFDFNTGEEVLALIPPELLSRQVTLYKNYLKLGDRSPTGQFQDINLHLWGVATSLKYADVLDSSNVWHTVGLLTLGPSGRSLTAIDITHPSPTDTGYGFLSGTDPVKILWRIPDGTLAGLYYTWSLPAIAASASDKFQTFFGSGFNPASTEASSQNASLFRIPTLDPLSPTSVTLPTRADGIPNLVGQQAFAWSTFFDTTKPTYYGDNLANLALQEDLQGRIWFNYDASGTGTFSDVSIGIDASAHTNVQEPQPIYYPPAVSGLGTSGCQTYVFGSGTPYEKSKEITNPPNASTPWSPRLYIAVNNQKGPSFNTKIPDGQIIFTKITDIPKPKDDPYYDGVIHVYDPNNPVFLGPRTQMTSQPLLIVTMAGTGTFQALYLLYDPDNGCRGFSYVVSIFYSISSCNAITVSKTEVVTAGEGAASGYALAGTKVVVGVSGPGAGNSADIKGTGATVIPPGVASDVTPVYWRELR